MCLTSQQKRQRKKTWKLWLIEKLAYDPELQSITQLKPAPPKQTKSDFFLLFFFCSVDLLFLRHTHTLREQSQMKLTHYTIFQLKRSRQSALDPQILLSHEIKHELYPSRDSIEPEQLASVAVLEWFCSEKKRNQRNIEEWLLVGCEDCPFCKEKWGNNAQKCNI